MNFPWAINRLNVPFCPTFRSLSLPPSTGVDAMCVCCVCTLPRSKSHYYWLSVISTWYLTLSKGSKQTPSFVCKAAITYINRADILPWKVSGVSLRQKAASSVYKYCVRTQHSLHQLLLMERATVSGTSTLTRRLAGEDFIGRCRCESFESYRLWTFQFKMSHTEEIMYAGERGSGIRGRQSMFGPYNTSFLNVNSTYLVTLPHINFYTLQGSYHISHWAIAMHHLFAFVNVMGQWLVKCPFGTPAIWSKSQTTSDIRYSAIMWKIYIIIFLLTLCDWIKLGITGLNWEGNGLYQLHIWSFLTGFSNKQTHRQTARKKIEKAYLWKYAKNKNK
jgi:hypothetical protein